MNTPLSAALHPLSFEFSRQVDGRHAREHQITEWQRILGPGVTPPKARILAEHPLVASPRLQRELDQHAQELSTFVTGQLARDSRKDPGWPSLGRPDVICADLAIVEDASAEDGWSLRWVEFQAFTSIVAAVHTLHLSATNIWTETRDLLPWQLPPGESDWLSAAQAWVAPAGGVLLERAPQQQTTHFDIEAAAHLFNLTLVEPHQLARNGNVLTYEDAQGMLRPVNHIFNRLVLHELADRPRFERLLADAEVSWHSHPAWYYNMSKAWLPELPQNATSRCAKAYEWRSLGLPANALVAKNAYSHGGAEVLLHVDEQFLDSLADARNWIVQPRYQPQPLFAARDGHPIFGEVRCVIAMPHGRAPWLACQLVRLSRGAKASSSGFSELPGSGVAVLYRPPGL